MPFSREILSLETMPKRASTRQSIKNIHHYPPIPPIYKYPVEIFDEIFSMACTDGGKTGRSLSTVSKRICEVSKVFKHQTLQVKRHQLRPLARVLRSLPLNARRVVHLLILSPNSGQPFFCLPSSWSFPCPDEHNLFSLIMRNGPTLEVLKLWCPLARQHGIEYSLEKPTSLKIVVCPCYQSNTHWWGNLKSEIDTLARSHEIIIIEG